MKNDQTPIFSGQTQEFWFKIGNQEADNPFRTLLLGKKKGDVLLTTNKGLQEYFSNRFDAYYLFRINILDILPYKYFDFDLFKKHFRIKTNKDMNRKLIEVFSFRNDVSQRHAMVEETLKLLITKNRISVPNYIISREQKSVLEKVKENPDYNVYRAQKDFEQRVRQLAEKHAKEKNCIDQLAYHENINLTNQDIKSYLNLGLRPRTKEFIYFRQEEPTLEGQEVPIPSDTLKYTCLREKTINYAIYHLTKK